MKKALLITFLISIFITGFKSAPQNNAEAAEYFENIYNIIREVNVRDLQYSKSIIYQRRNSKVERKRDNVVSETKEAIAKLKAMPSFEGDSNLRDISIEVLRSKLDIMSVKLVKISKMQESAYESYEALEEYYEESNEVMEELAGEFEKLSDAQIQFASDNGFTLDENRTRLAK